MTRNNGKNGKAVSKPAGPTHEKCFDLALPALVRGKDAEGLPFEEETEIARISSEEAVFKLRQRVLLDASLDLTLNIPRTLILGGDMNMRLSGIVRSVIAETTNGGAQVIALSLGRTFSIRLQAG